jgi:cell cycle checkpoint control protein RAD9A
MSFLAVLSKPLQTSIAVEADEFDDIEVEDKLHIVISVKDFRAIIQHAGITGNDLSARYSLPARPIQLSYSSDAIYCEFLIMTVGERGSNPAQKTKKGRKAAAQANVPRLEATSARPSAAPSELPQRPAVAPPSSAAVAHPMPSLSASRTGLSRTGLFDLRPPNRPVPPPASAASQSLFVEDEGWEPVRDDDDRDDEDNARLGWDDSIDPVCRDCISRLLHELTRQDAPSMHMSMIERQRREAERETSGASGQPKAGPVAPSLDPTQPLVPTEPATTQRLSDVENLALFPD